MVAPGLHLCDQDSSLMARHSQSCPHIQSYSDKSGKEILFDRVYGLHTRTEKESVCISAECQYGLACQHGADYADRGNTKPLGAFCTGDNTVSALRLSTPMMDADSVEMSWQPSRIKASFRISRDALHTVLICNFLLYLNICLIMYIFTYT